MKEEKLKQLRKIFSKVIENIIRSVKSGYVDFDNEHLTKRYVKKETDNLVYEVKIRINNK